MQYIINALVSKTGLCSGDYRDIQNMNMLLTPYKQNCNNIIKNKYNNISNDNNEIKKK